jgi:hypothetical protein
MKRSFCASGRGYVPSYSIGFCVAKTVKCWGERVRVAVDRHAPFLHRLEQGGLGLGRRAIDFISEQKRGEDRAFDERELVLLHVEDARPVMSAGIKSGVN